LDSVANLSNLERQELFGQTAANRGFHPAIAEKDFWVCWVLMKLFESPVLTQQLIFKGGTSLSKAHHLIQRFSEDIDLVLNWELLGYGRGGSDPWRRIPSNTQLDRLNREFNDKAADYITNKLLPLVSALLNTCPEVRVTVSATDPQVIEIRYPNAFSLDVLRPAVKLEIGPLASWVPSGRYLIRSFAAEEFPGVFDVPECHVTAITAERTFWEKATILHQQAHRTKPMPAGYSRHYYDLYQLARSQVGENALQDMNLLSDVVAFKQRFYRSSWARYDLAKPGSFRLLPEQAGERALQADYRNMRPMFFTPPPTWDEIMLSLGRLEDRINHPDANG
jgi:hypothetical protein